ncbi:hypothetical protein [uncultured Mitsuokella sp.]|uniref:hypothetical protein n=1 Tax=uncultured Mitsuokella sp. TaxID=453120 RepID=UPI0025FE82AF|nr:hypothetical protein [uncultured Mitsuokella sp.]
MSGPKVSVYTLTAEEIAAIQQELLHQQQIALRRAQLLQQAEKYQQKIHEQENSLQELEASMPANGGQWAKADTLQSRIKQMWATLSSLQRNLTAMKGLAYSDEQNDEIEQQLAEIDAKLRENNREIHAGYGESADLRARLAKMLDSEIFGLFTAECAPKAANDAGNTAKHQAQQTVRPFVKDSIEKLLDLKDNPYLPILYKQEVAKAVARMKLANEQHRLDAFCEIELPEMLAECQDFLDLWQEIGQEYQDLLLQYETLCDLNGTEKRAAVPFDHAAIAVLKKQIQQEKSKAEAQAQKTYIQQALNEVMEDMGYDVLGQREVQKRNGTHFRNELYQYGGDTAIDVTYADNGQISLELGKLDKTDRLPTPAECSQLENQMLTFCDRFKEIEARLSDKGVIVGNRIALTPASADYAQVINVEDYELKKTRKNGQKIKVTKPKAMASE